MDLILKYFPNLTPKQAEQFAQLDPLYKYWNDKINVISRKDIESLYEKHILHSLSISKHFNFANNTTLLDVGTGGGFPGIPLAIMHPNANFTLVDSIGKKITVVQSIISELKLTNCVASQARAEDLNAKYSFIISRAVTDFSTFTKWVKNKISPIELNMFHNGIIYLKGGDLSEELKDFQHKIKTYNISDIFEEPFFETKKIIYLPQTK